MAIKRVWLVILILCAVIGIFSFGVFYSRDYLFCCAKSMPSKNVCYGLAIDMCKECGYPNNVNTSDCKIRTQIENVSSEALVNLCGEYLKAYLTNQSIDCPKLFYDLSTRG